MTTPAEDQEMAAFVAWAVKKYGQHAYRHTSTTSGEWAAWRAGRIAECERCAVLCEGLAKVMTPDRRSTAEDLARAIRGDQP